LVMIGLTVRLECYRQYCRKRLLSISKTSGNKYHVVLFFLVAVLTIPVVGSDVATSPVGGLSFLGAEAGIFLMLLFLGLFFIMTVVFAPLGGLIL
jgi:hypothetical protein